MRPLRRLRPRGPATSATSTPSRDPADALAGTGRSLLQPAATPGPRGASIPEEVAGGRNPLRPEIPNGRAASGGRVAEVAEVAGHGPLPYPPGWRGWPGEAAPAPALPCLATAPLGRCRRCRFHAPVAPDGLCGACRWRDAPGGEG